MTATRDELERAWCWEASDRIPSRPQMTEFRREMRLHQARWREAGGLPIGAMPMSAAPDDPGARPVGSRIRLPVARDGGGNYLTPAARQCATERSQRKEPQQSFDHQGVWADLLSSLAMTINAFADLAADPAAASATLRGLAPSISGDVVDVAFAHSPGRMDPDFLGNLIDFDAAITMDCPDRGPGIVGVTTLLHESLHRETAKPTRLGRYAQVARRSGAFRRGATEQLSRSDLLVTWLTHLLALSMIQHPSGDWAWAHTILLHPAGNVDAADIGRRYSDLLTDGSTFSVLTLEQFLDSAALPDAVRSALRERYVIG